MYDFSPFLADFNEIFLSKFCETFIVDNNKVYNNNVMCYKQQNG